MSNQKGFSKVAIIVIVFILIGGAYFIYDNNKKDKDVLSSDQMSTSQSSSQNSIQSKEKQILTAEEMPEELTYEENLKLQGWKTYRNEKYGFEVKYPEKWREESCSSIQWACVSFYPLGKKKGDNFLTYRGDVLIANPKLPKNFSIEYFLKEFNDYLFTKSQKYESVSVGEEKSFYFHNVSNFISTPDIVVIPNTHKSAYVWIENLSDEKIFNQILSTFKFTK